mmetsp:Transcript_64072/g.171445  ORF Transcript_64072/g.171445 Transcript_64072/m.171445 type:complete len:216 (-) Transcript_64072:772-1419(-)
MSPRRNTTLQRPQPRTLESSSSNAHRPQMYWKLWSRTPGSTTEQDSRHQLRQRQLEMSYGARPGGYALHTATVAAKINAKSNKTKRSTQNCDEQHSPNWKCSYSQTSTVFRWCHNLAFRWAITVRGDGNMTSSSSLGSSVRDSPCISTIWLPRYSDWKLTAMTSASCTPNKTWKESSALSESADILIFGLCEERVDLELDVSASNDSADWLPRTL